MKAPISSPRLICRVVRVWSARGAASAHAANGHTKSNTAVTLGRQASSFRNMAILSREWFRQRALNDETRRYERLIEDT